MLVMWNNRCPVPTVLPLTIEVHLLNQLKLIFFDILVIRASVGGINLLRLVVIGGGRDGGWGRRWRSQVFHHHHWRQRVDHRAKVRIGESRITSRGPEVKAVLFVLVLSGGPLLAVGHEDRSSVEVFVLDGLAKQDSKLADVVHGRPEGVHLAGFVLQVGNVVTQRWKSVVDLKLKMLCRGRYLIINITNLYYSKHNKVYFLNNRNKLKVSLIFFEIFLKKRI